MTWKENYKRSQACGRLDLGGRQREACTDGWFVRLEAGVDMGELGL